VTFQKVANIPKSLLEEEEDLAKAKCSQINYSYYFGTSHIYVCLVTPGTGAYNGEQKGQSCLY
jgi:hypothetical protein